MMPRMMIAAVLIVVGSGCASQVGIREARHRVVAPTYTSLVVEGRYKKKSDTITTNEDLMLTLDQLPEHIDPADPNSWEHHFRVYCRVGANTPNTITIHNTAPTLQIEDGWAYFTGKHPVGQTTKGIGAGDGTSFAILFNPSADLFVNMSVDPMDTVQVKHLQSGNGKTLTPGTHCYVKDDGTVTNPASNSSSSQVQDFIGEVQLALSKAGF